MLLSLIPYYVPQFCVQKKMKKIKTIQGKKTSDKECEYLYDKGMEKKTLTK